MLKCSGQFYLISCVNYEIHSFLVQKRKYFVFVKERSLNNKRLLKKNSRKKAIIKVELIEFIFDIFN